LTIPKGIKIDTTKKDRPDANKKISGPEKNHEESAFYAPKTLFYDHRFFLASLVLLE